MSPKPIATRLCVPGSTISIPLTSTSHRMYRAMTSASSARTSATLPPSGRSIATACTVGFAPEAALRERLVKHLAVSRG